MTPRGPWSACTLLFQVWGYVPIASESHMSMTCRKLPIRVDGYFSERGDISKLGPGANLRYTLCSYLFWLPDVYLKLISSPNLRALECANPLDMGILIWTLSKRFIDVAALRSVTFRMTGRKSGRIDDIDRHHPPYDKHLLVMLHSYYLTQLLYLCIL